MIGGWEWIVIGVIALVIIFWGSTKIPELARALGRVKGEFNKGSKEYPDDATAVSSSSQVVNTTPVEPKDKVLFDTAHRLGISTVGKTKEQVAEEIRVKLLNS